MAPSCPQELVFAELDRSSPTIVGDGDVLEVVAAKKVDTVVDVLGSDLEFRPGEAERRIQVGERDLEPALN